ncbi:MAG: ChaN family lipoprotein [Hydrococcus sp. SU_1_0]|nr:ChaN family lipoprotein [Hydrococcus sp. SU_1_0]
MKLWQEAIALQHQHYPNTPIIVLVGKAHVMYDYAIPERVERRINDPNFTQTVILLDE